jgi:YidC/Oxa1 family membrane protein insertase
VMPVFLAVISFNFPLGILLYWVTTNFWQVAQQAIILREVQHEVETGEIVNKPGGAAAKRTLKKGKDAPGPGSSSTSGRRSPGASTGKRPSEGSAPDPAPEPDPDLAPEGDSGPSPETEPSRDPSPKAQPTDGTPVDGATPAESRERPRNRDHLPKRRGGTT